MNYSYKKIGLFVILILLFVSFFNFVYATDATNWDDDDKGLNDPDNKFIGANKMNHVDDSYVVNAFADEDDIEGELEDYSGRRVKDITNSKSWEEVVSGILGVDLFTWDKGWPWQADWSMVTKDPSFWYDVLPWEIEICTKGLEDDLSVYAKDSGVGIKTPKTVYDIHFQITGKSFNYSYSDSLFRSVKDKNILYDLTWYFEVPANYNGLWGNFYSIYLTNDDFGDDKYKFVEKPFIPSKDDLFVNQKEYSSHLAKVKAGTSATGSSSFYESKFYKYMVLYVENLRADDNEHMTSKSPYGYYVIEIKNMKNGGGN